MSTSRNEASRPPGVAIGEMRTSKLPFAVSQLAIVVAFALATTLNLAGAEPAPLNVLFIAADDLRVELACYGQSHVVSPNIDRLAKQGTQFNRAYCQQAVCNVSRASLFTGLRPDTIRVWDLPTHFRQNKPEVVTLPQLFKQHGYHSQCIGKMFHNWRQEKWKGDRASWSVPSAMHYGAHGRDKPMVEGKLPPNLASGKGGTDCRAVPDNAYYDGRITDASIVALRELGKGKAPFFLAVGFWKPHTPFNAPKKYWDLYQREKIPVPKHLQPPTNIPGIAMTEYRFDGRKNATELREMHHGHLAAISFLDAQVGRLLGELDALGLRRNTIIVFWSDHGLHLGEHGLLRKTTNFELDAAVPLIISSPHHPKAQQSDALVELLDLYPTLAELCGLPAPKDLEGVSLVPILKDPHQTVKQVALTQVPRPPYPRGKDPEAMGYSIRAPRYRYAEWRDFKTGEIKARELYDHDNDPGETANVIDDAKHAEAVRRLAAQLREVVKEGARPLN